MELFAATTGCQDSAVASLYLERADNDVSRAVNFFFDAPPPDAAAAAAIKTAQPAGVGLATPTSISGGECSTTSHARSLKRQRSESAGGKQQQRSMSERVRLSTMASSRSECAGNNGKDRQCGVVSAEISHDRARFAGAAAALPSRECTRIAESCIRCKQHLGRLSISSTHC